MASHPPATLLQCGGSWVRNRSNIRELSKDLAFMLVLPHLWTCCTVTLRSCVCVTLQWGSARGIYVQAWPWTSYSLWSIRLPLDIRHDCTAFALGRGGQDWMNLMAYLSPSWRFRRLDCFSSHVVDLFARAGFCTQAFVHKDCLNEFPVCMQWNAKN